jgi:DnaJ-class molecular chaperone
MSTSARAQVLLWAQRVIARKDAAANQLLEIPSTATLEQAQDAFHKIARTSHPDLHRNGLNAEELQQVTDAYALVAGAYQAFRSQTPGAANKPGTSGPATGSQPMNPRAATYFQKAQQALDRGDMRGAVLQLKMACAADPQNQTLRGALAEVEAELKKG